MDKNLERLLRIMGTFDLATGHAETMEEALDSLESELRDVLGFYREAFKRQPLSNEAINNIFDALMSTEHEKSIYDLAHEIEKAHGITNEP